MALSLTPSAGDAPAAYWRIERYQADRRAGTVEVLLCGYAGKAASDAGAAPVAHTRMLVTAAQLGGPVEGATLPALYAALRGAAQLTSQGVDRATRESDLFFAVAGDL